MVVLDASRPLDDDDLELLRETAALPRLVVGNKSDLAAAWSSVGGGRAGRAGVVEDRRRPRRPAAASCARRSKDRGARRVPRDTAAVTNVRHAALLERARAGAASRAATSVEQPGGPVPEEFVLTDLQDARAALEEVTGKRTSEDLLRHIFSRFCIGK